MIHVATQTKKKTCSNTVYFTFMREHLSYMSMLNFRKKEKEYSIFACGTDLFVLLYLYASDFGCHNFTDFILDSIKYNMPCLHIPAYMMLLRKSVIFLDFHKHE